MKPLRTTVGIALAGVALLAPSTALAEGPTAKAAAFSFSGKTSQNDGVALRVASSLRRVDGAIGWKVNCDSGASFNDTTRFRVASGIQNNSVKFAAEDSYGIRDVAPGLDAIVTVEVTGKIRARTGNGSGTLQVTSRVQDKNGNAVDNCTTGASPITWRVKQR